MYIYTYAERGKTDENAIQRLTGLNLHFAATAVFFSLSVCGFQLAIVMERGHSPRRAVYTVAHVCCSAGVF